MSLRPPQASHLFPSFIQPQTMLSFSVNPEYSRIDEVIPGLFISGVTALNVSTLEDHHITYIINATTEVPNLRSLSHIARHKLWMEDTSDTYIYPLLESQSDQIASLLSEGHSVLVHCVAGVSRSASLILSFLTKYRCSSLKESYLLLSSKRPLVRPNLGFWRQLITFEENTKNVASSVKLIRDDVQEECLLPDVYLPEAISETSIPSSSMHRSSSGGKSKFRPVLSSLSELVA